MKKIAFVAHEFGMYKGRGGIASYLYYLCKGMLEYNTDVEVHAVAPVVDEKCELQENPRFRLHKFINGGLDQINQRVMDILIEIQPDYVEMSDYMGMCLAAIQYRNAGGMELSNTVFTTMSHTSSQECFEWSTELPLKLADRGTQGAEVQEKAQLLLSDLDAFPSAFLKGYVERKYGLINTKILRYTYETDYYTKTELLNKIEKVYDLMEYRDKFVISYISRLEGRKNQEGLIKAFVKYLDIAEDYAEKSILIIAGNSVENPVTHESERKRIYDLIPLRYTKNIKFFDFVGKEMYDEICAVSDVAVMASYFENFPFAMMEYVYRGIPIMASQYSGCFDYMGKYSENTSFNPFDEQDIVCKIQGMADETKEKLNAIAEEQFLQLNNMCAPQFSTSEKLNMYDKLQADFKEKKSEEMDIKEISIEDLGKKATDLLIPDTKYMLVFHGSVDRQVIKKFVKESGQIWENSNRCMIAFWGNYDYPLNIEEALDKSKSFVLNDFSVDTNEELFIDCITKEMMNRDFTYIPFLGYKEKNDSLMFRKILEGYFYRKNRIDKRKLVE